jgi:hypothetical protein
MTPPKIPDCKPDAPGVIRCTALVRCRDCKHWKTPNPEWGEMYDRNQEPDKGWWDGVCVRLRHGITITASGGWEGATVDSVETDGNFACIYGETPNDKLRHSAPAEDSDNTKNI